MNNISFSRVLLLMSLAGIGTPIFGLPAQAETDNSVAGTHQANSNQSDKGNISTYPTLLTELVNKDNTLPQRVSDVNSDLQSQPTEKPRAKTESAEKTQAIPGTAATSAEVLLEEPTSSGTRGGKGRRVAQYEIEPGRETRSGRSYIGIGGNIGLTGSSGVGDNAFTAFAKIGLTRVLSVRPQLVLADDTDIIIPITYDFPIQAEPFERLNFAPYVGAGVVITTYRDSNVGLVLTGGIDVPITGQFTATGSVTAAFVDTTSLGLTLGVAYNFGPGFDF